MQEAASHGLSDEDQEDDPLYFAAQEADLEATAPCSRSVVLSPASYEGQVRRDTFLLILHSVLSPSSGLGCTAD